MNKYAKSWIFWLVLIMIVIILLAFFVSRGDSKYYELSSVDKVVQPLIYDINNDVNYKVRPGTQYRISENPEQYENEYYENSGYSEGEYIQEYPEEHINLEPELPPTFLSEPSVGDPSGINRTKPEKICRDALEKIYKRKFSRVHPEWLRNPESNRKLELDCYNDELKIACEYNGPQHYVWPNHFPMTREQFLAQNRRDNFKINRCDEMGVYLITVPYNVPNDLIPDYINHYLPHNVQRRRDYGIIE